MNKPKPKRSSYTPLIGFVVAVILGIIGWIIAPGVLQGLSSAIPSFAGNALPLSTSRPIFTVLVVLLALVIFGLVAALTAKKDPQGARESQMEKERDAMRRRQKAERAQQRKR